MVMLIEIGKDVVEMAARNDRKAIDVLRDLAFAFKKCMHIVYTDRESIETILKIDALSQEEKRVFQIISLKMTSYQRFYKQFAFHVFVTFNKPSSFDTNLAIVNPNDARDFEFYSKTFLLTENQRDASFYEYVADYYMRKKQIHGFRKESENVPGGGDTTVQFCDEQIKNRKHFCLAIVDSDLHYKNGCLKDTSMKVKCCIDSKSPFNCRYYIIEDLSEIENMIPFHIISTFSNYKNLPIVRDGLSFCLDYFDYKNGLTTHELINDEFYRYWIATIGHLNEIYDVAESYRRKALQCGCRDKYAKQKQEVLIDGFGEKLLSTVMDDDNALTSLRSVTDADLSPTQQVVWSAMGQMIFEWCCAFRNFKNS